MNFIMLKLVFKSVLYVIKTSLTKISLVNFLFIVFFFFTHEYNTLIDVFQAYSSPISIFFYFQNSKPNAGPPPPMQNFNAGNQHGHINRFYSSNSAFSPIGMPGISLYINHSKNNFFRY